MSVSSPSCQTESSVVSGAEDDGGLLSGAELSVLGSFAVPQAASIPIHISTLKRTEMIFFIMYSLLIFAWHFIITQ